MLRVHSPPSDAGESEAIAMALEWPADLLIMDESSGRDIYHNPETGRSQPVPRHREINELLAKKILRDLTKKPE